MWTARFGPMSEEVLAATEPCGAGSVAGEEDDTSLREVPAPCKEVSRVTESARPS